MKLSLLNTKIKINILKDGEFSNMGHAVVQDQENMLTFCDSKDYIADDIAIILDIASMLSSAKVSKKVLKKYFNALDTELTDRIKSFLRNENNIHQAIYECGYIVIDSTEEGFYITSE